MVSNDPLTFCTSLQFCNKLAASSCRANTNHTQTMGSSDFLAYMYILKYKLKSEIKLKEWVAYTWKLDLIARHLKE